MENNIQLLEKALLIGRLVDLAIQYKIDPDTIAPEVPRPELIGVFEKSFAILEAEFSNNEHAKAVVKDMLEKAIREYEYMVLAQQM